jgi:hypothetical protein
MRRALYWLIHITITAALWAVLHLHMGLPSWGAALVCALVALVDDTAVAGLARSVGRR